MKFIYTIFLLFIGLFTNARFIQGSIVFKDGHTETGLIKSFLENDIVDYNFSSKLEKQFNMDDTSLKFKVSEDGELKTYNITLIKEVSIYRGATFVPLPIKTFNKEGQIIDLKMLIWLQLVERGKINLYGFQYVEYSKDIGPSYYSRFYFQKENDEFAILPYSKMTLFSKKANIAIKNAFYSYLFDSCPEFYTNNAERFKKVIYDDFTRKEKRERIEAYSARLKNFQVKKANRTMRNAFELNHNDISIFMNEFKEYCN